MTRIESVVFDLGGVLIEWDPRFLYRKILSSDEEIEEMIRDLDLFAWNEELDRGRTFEEVSSERLELHPKHRTSIEAYRDRWPETMKGEIRGTVEILHGLHAAGYGLYALTNWSSETFPFARERFDFLSLFNEVVVSGEERLIKPDPAIYEVLISRTGIVPSSSIFIDDRRDNVKTAQSLGFHGVVYESPEGLRRELEALNVSVRPASP